ncbi:MAG: SDR family oxidoreductase [Okeania sp. SIO3H1]|uniref:SDR family oxidoreductase n=1 Tax=Okeania sp. SIO1I7 TaxID=2607772 RepID=UPI0013CDAA92|nr:SDR family oxidoreductase [Okeania sp. SIO1I7]NEN90976.1 SDR family oxidoreductase [Okeania sp. SIO3H1]NET28989.1 SDR family oxidoreductase [Okeania sp. SIO1I7]
MKRSIKGSIAISGASSGIGEACAIYLDQLGYQVFAGVRNKVDGETLKRKTLDRVIPIIFDVTDRMSIEMAVETIQPLLNVHGLTGLINNAGIVTTGPLEFLPIDELRKQLEVNVLGQISVTQAFLPLLRKSEGRIINIGSDYGRVSGPLLGPYCASKFAMEALTDALRMELKPWAIDVSIIEIGTVRTPIWNKSIDQVNKIWEKFPEQAKQLYSPIFEAVKETAGKLEKNGLSTDAVAKVIARAIIEEKPKNRYIVGLDAKTNILLSKILPSKVLDRLVMWYLGIPKNASITGEQSYITGQISND